MDRSGRIYVCMCGNGIPTTRTHRFTCCGRSVHSLVVLFCMRNGSERLKKGCSYVRNGLVTRREQEFAKQTQVVLIGGWSTDDNTSRLWPVWIKLEPLLRRYSWKKVPQKYGRIPYGPDARSRIQIHRPNRSAVVCRSLRSPARSGWCTAPRLPPPSTDSPHGAQLTVAVRTRRTVGVQRQWSRWPARTDCSSVHPPSMRRGGGGIASSPGQLASASGGGMGPHGPYSTGWSTCTCPERGVRGGCRTVLRGCTHRLRPETEHQRQTGLAGGRHLPRSRWRQHRV